MKTLFRSFVMMAAIGVSAHYALPASAYENTVRFKVSEERLWQCGEQFFATGGSETYRYARILSGDSEVARYDFANPADCSRVAETIVDLADGEKATFLVQVGAYRFGADISGRDRNRIWTISFFVDHANGALTEDSIPSGAKVASFANTVRFRISPDRLWQCGDQFFATGGSQTYQFVKLYVGGRMIAQYDLANPADCVRVTEEVIQLKDGEDGIVSAEVGGNRMEAKILGRDRNRIWTIGFFVDHANGELTEDYVGATKNE
jgi:hypothetical protein